MADENRPQDIPTRRFMGKDLILSCAIPEGQIHMHPETLLEIDEIAVREGRLLRGNGPVLGERHG